MKYVHYYAEIKRVCTCTGMVMILEVNGNARVALKDQKRTFAYNPGAQWE